MSSTTISVDRIETMVVSPNTHILQVSQFLLPTISMDAHPSLRPCEHISISSKLHPTRRAITFSGWVDRRPEWKEWVDSMKSVHSPVWKTVGIHDAIMNTLLNIQENQSLILWFAEKWSPQTNTFIFPWGEITITLEDMMVLGGFSVCGGPATSRVESPGDRVALNNLNKAYAELNRSPSKKVSSSAWMRKFKGQPNAHEHEAFLALWLSKFVFGSVKNTISHHTFQLAVLLASGRRIAMAPAVLATLYLDLHILQYAVSAFQRGVANEVAQEVFSPMYYFQVWIWERFTRVRPRGISHTRNDETRVARWAGLNNEVADLWTLDDRTREEHFVWRPYVKDTNHFIALRVYKENGSVRNIDNEEVESFARCLRVCRLVGLDIYQHYYPHRVCRQFGYSQDIPADILQIEDDEDAWVDYSTPLSTGNVYVPSREREGHVTLRYEEWWMTQSVSPAGPRIPPPLRRRRRMIMEN